ncbi:MAG: Maf family nucleotide pyrophosphatase [Propylenella sp.]
MTLVLASGSRARQALLANAGIAFEAVPAALDERAAEQPLIDAGAPPEDLVATLALAKAMQVSERRPGDLVIGADQMLALGGERFVKPEDMEAARRQLLRLSGKTHALHTAAAVIRSGEILWQHTEMAHLTMRRLGPAEIGRYLAEIGPQALESVGAYQLEGRGVRLFDKVEGDFFGILGLPLLPLIRFLREQGEVE